jgi:hypothetical protein
MEQDQFGIEQVTAGDRAYNGSRFSEVCEAIFANPYYQVWGREGEPLLPRYEATLANLLRGILPLGKHYFFGQASIRTVDSHADLRWGPDGKGFRRIIHSNGVCLTGLWEVTEETEYSGYFRKGSRGLLVGRYSTCCTKVHRGELRALALVGKLFPTIDPDHAEPLCTASFITIKDLAGNYTGYINDAELLSAPDGAGQVWPSLVLFLPSWIRKPTCAKCTRSPNSVNRWTNPRGRPRSCASSSRPINPGSKVKTWISATKSWRRFSTRAIPFRNASSRFTSK